MSNWLIRQRYGFGAGHRSRINNGRAISYTIINRNRKGYCNLLTRING